MSAYVLADNIVHDRNTFDEYRGLVGPTVLAHGGKYLVRGAPAETVEGSWVPNGLVVIEFESEESARQWYESSEYAAIKGLRQDSASSSLIIVDGV